jgi:hypothetical protein
VLKNKDPKAWYLIPIMSKFLIIALYALLLIIGASISPNVNIENLGDGLLNSSGTEL